MKQIELTQGQVAIVDDDDFEALNKFKWYAAKYRNGKTYYAQRFAPRVDGHRTFISMHRQITSARPREIIDHRNHNGLDNRRDNLRRCERGGQNTCNASGLRADNTSGYRGVYWDKEQEKWMVQIGHEGRCIKIGRYPTKHEAAVAYNEAAIKYHGEFATLNMVDDEFATSA